MREEIAHTSTAADLGKYYRGRREGLRQKGKSIDWAKGGDRADWCRCGPREVTSSRQREVHAPIRAASGPREKESIVFDGSNQTKGGDRADRCHCGSVADLVI